MELIYFPIQIGELDDVINLSDTSISVECEMDRFERLASGIENTNWLSDNLIDCFTLKMDNKFNKDEFLLIPVRSTVVIDSVR